jgi:hypothetical protein
MTDQDYIIQLYKYYSKFVSKQVLTDTFSQNEESKNAGYDELKAEMLSQPDTTVIDQVATFVVSTNNEFVEDRVRNSKGIILFVEYGSFNFNPIITGGVTEAIGISVCMEYSISNNDNLNEALIMNKCNNILNAILVQMQADQSELDSCSPNGLIKFPAKIHAIDPKAFFGRIGWTAIFDNETSAL